MRLFWQLALGAIVWLILGITHLSSQTILSLDLKSNSFRRGTIVNDSLEIEKLKDSLTIDYINKTPHRRFKIEDINYTSAFRKTLKVGDYLVFEITNLDTKGRTDSVAIGFAFLDRNTQYNKVFQSILNKGLTSLINADQGSSGGTEETNPNEQTDKEISRIPDSVELTSITNFEVLDQKAIDFYNLLKIYSKDCNRTPESLLEAVRDSLNLLPNLDSIYADSLQYDTIRNGLLLKAIVDEISPIYNEGIEDTITNILNGICNRVYNTKELSSYIAAMDASVTAQEKERKEKILASTKVDSTIRSIAYIPIQIENKDVTYFYIEGFKRGKKVYERPYIFHNKRGFKVDFSTGFFASTLRDSTYSSRSVAINDTTNVNRVFGTDEGSFFVGLGLLAHFYSRQGPRSNLALSAGFMLNSNTQLNYLAGLSGILGLEQRLVINIGFSAGQVKRAADSFEVGSIVAEGINIIPTKDIWDVGCYFGLSYNF